VVRFLSALRIAPGGLGIFGLGYIGGLVLVGRHYTDVPLTVFQAQVTAAVLVSPSADVPAVNPVDHSG
jgi:hypothetical protein